MVKEAFIAQTRASGLGAENGYPVATAPGTDSIVISPAGQLGG